MPSEETVIFVVWLALLDLPFFLVLSFILFRMKRLRHPVVWFFWSLQSILTVMVCMFFIAAFFSFYE